VSHSPVRSVPDGPMTSCCGRLDSPVQFSVTFVCLLGFHCMTARTSKDPISEPRAQGAPNSRLPDDILARDWRQALRSALLSARFHEWQAREPALARFGDAAALIRFMRTRGSHAEKDAVLCALLVWAKQEPIGARIVLEAIRPGLLNLSSRIARGAREREEVWATMLLAIWEGIRCYPLARRPRRVAANLLLDTMHRTLVELGHESAWRGVWSFSCEKSEGEAPQEIDRDLDGVLDRAIRAGAVSAEEAEVILCSRIDGVELAELAHAAGVSYGAMKMRRQRAERRLLLFLGRPRVPDGQRNQPSSLARVSGVGPQGPVG
jgi:DNA-directed RNA polymerase specialized sigma24 family protein